MRPISLVRFWLFCWLNKDHEWNQLLSNKKILNKRGKGDALFLLSDFCVATIKAPQKLIILFFPCQVCVSLLKPFWFCVPVSDNHSGPLHNKMFSNVFDFASPNTHWLIRVHTIPGHYHFCSLFNRPHWSARKRWYTWNNVILTTTSNRLFPQSFKICTSSRGPGLNSRRIVTSSKKIKTPESVCTLSWILTV